MTSFDVAVVGTGPEPENKDWGNSAAMAYEHGEAYRTLDGSELVACCDIVRENAEAFADEFAIPDEHVFEDYTRMLDELDVDVVSVCTPVPTHADIVVEICETGVPDAIHCEKPMADTWAASRRMAAAAEDAGVQLTFNHQRRFGPQWHRAKELLDEGAIGDLERVEMGRKNLFDYGSHTMDLCNYFADEQRAEWVLGQVHYAEADVRYGTHNENQATALWQYPDGTYGFAATGKDVGGDAVPCEHRLLGTEGVIEVNPDRVEADDTSVRYRGPDTQGWVEEAHAADRPLITLCIEHVLDCLDSGETPVVGADAALRTTETIYAAWESARRHERVTLPIDVEGNPLTEMVEDGELTPAGLDD